MASRVKVVDESIKMVFFEFWRGSDLAKLKGCIWTIYVNYHG